MNLQDLTTTGIAIIVAVIVVIIAAVVLYLHRRRSQRLREIMVQDCDKRTCQEGINTAKKTIVLNTAFTASLRVLTFVLVRLKTNWRVLT